MNGGILKTVILEKNRDESGQKVRKALRTWHNIRKGIAAANCTGEGYILSGQDGKSSFHNTTLNFRSLCHEKKSVCGRGWRKQKKWKKGRTEFILI